MAHLQYMPGDPRLVDQLVYELKSKGIFDQFRKDCIADVDTRPAYQNLRQRVENSVTTFLSMQTWQPDMNKNQLREKLRKHILDGNYLEQGVERIVDQVVNPKVATVFIPKVEDLVYKVLGITRKKSPSAETSNEKVEDLLPNDLEAVSPGSVKIDDDKNEAMDVDVSQDDNMDIEDEKSKLEEKQDSNNFESEKENTRDIQLPNNRQNDEADKSNIPLPSEEIKPENIPSPDASPPKTELEKIELPKELIISTDIPLPNDVCKEDKDQYFKPVNSEDDDSSSGSSLRRNMSPLTPIRNFNNENSCDAQQAFENDSSDTKCEDKKEPSSFRFKIDAKSSENSSDAVKAEKKEAETLSYQFNSQVNINNYNTPLYEDSSNSNNLHIDYESDVNSKVNIEIKVPENDHNSEDSRKEKKTEEKKSSHKSSSSHRSRDAHKHSGSKDKRSNSKHTNSRDSSRHDRSKSSKDDIKSKSSDKEKSKDKSEKKDSSRESSRHRSSHKSSHKDSKSHRSSSSSGRHSSKHSDEKKLSSSSSSHRDKDKSSDKNSSEKSKDSKSSSHKSHKERKSSSSSRNDKSSSKNKDAKEKEKKSKKENDDHYSLSGRGNPNRRSTDRDSNDGSSSSKGSHNPTNSKSSNCKKDSKSSSKSETTTTSGESTSPSDKENRVQEQHSSKTREALQHKPIVRIERRLEVASPPRLPFVPDVTIRKPKFAANLEEAKRLMKMRKFLDEEQKRMNQEAALLLEFQANVRPSMSQVYSNIPGPELEFACVSNVGHSHEMVVQSNDNINHALPEGHDDGNHEHESINIVPPEEDTVIQDSKTHYTNNELLTVLNDTKDDEANEVMSYEEAIDNINETDTKSVDIVIESNKITDQQIEINTETSDKILKNIENNSDGSIDDISNISVSEEPLETVINVSNRAIVLMEMTETDIENNEILTKEIEQPKKYNKKQSSVLQVTGITEISEETPNNDIAETQKTVNCNINDTIAKNEKMDEKTEVQNEEESLINGEYKLHYFGEREKYNAELERAQFNNFFKEYNKKTALNDKLYLVNCDSYEENIIREVSKDLGGYEIISYHRNGHLTLPKNKNVIKNVNISTEISLPLETDYGGAYYDENEPANNVFSPEKSECSFELTTDYDSKLQEMVSKTSRQEIMEIILGNVVDTSPSKMPQIDYVTESKIDSDYEINLKRKISEIGDETTANVNNNRPVLTPNKIRKLSTDQITSTTQENEETPANKTLITRSKYLGRARRVGLPRPKRTALPSSPSSDKSVENYEENALATPATPNGKVTRSKVQRYDTSDLYKPKLHYLSRRNHVT